MERTSRFEDEVGYPYLLRLDDIIPIENLQPTFVANKLRMSERLKGRRAE